MDVQTFLDTGVAPVPFSMLTLDRELVRDIQGLLTRIGLLDPPADGKFGTISELALEELCRRAQLPANGVFTVEVARALLEAESRDLFPLRPGSDLAGRLVRSLQAQGHFVARHPGFRNIVYVEGCDTDGNPNDDARNKFNDSRFVLSVNDSGTPTILGAWEGTTEPGKKFTLKPMQRQGAARIAFGQYKSWVVGIHKKSHEALIQADDVTVFRDLNKDFEREGDQVFKGMFGINQHWGFDLPVDDIGGASAGCLVGRTKAGHKEFMRIVKQDLRFERSRGYHFVSTVISASQLQATGIVEEEDMATVIMLREEERKDEADKQLWLYAGGQRRKIRTIPELTELREKGLLSGPELALSRETLDGIPIMQGAE